MKRNPFIFAAMTTLLIGCTQEFDSLSDSNSRADQLQQSSLSVNQALEISQQFLKKSNETRAYALEDIEVIPVTRENGKTRSNENSDTLAYIFNYPEEGGFSIVSAKTGVYPILAFSDNGNFSLENEIAKANFVDNIGAFVDSPDMTFTTPNPDDFYFGHESENIAKFNLHQKAPFNKYVDLHYPKCLVGCAPVASAYMTICTASILDYKGHTFYLSSIYRALSQHDDPTYNPTAPLPEGFPTYTYEEAVDETALLMYEIAHNIGTGFIPGYSGGTPIGNAYYFFKPEVFNLKTNFEVMNFEKVYSWLEKYCMVFMEGTGLDTANHAWVCDGYKYLNSIAIAGAIPIVKYVHCNWGWNGECNGYFNGAIFETENGNLRPDNYFAIQIEIN